MSVTDKETGITYPADNAYLKKQGRLVSILPICQGCGRKLDYGDIGERCVDDFVVPKNLEEDEYVEGETRYARLLGFAEFCKHCGHSCGEYGDVQDATEGEYLEQQISNGMWMLFGQQKELEEKVER